MLKVSLTPSGSSVWKANLRSRNTTMHVILVLFRYMAIARYGTQSWGQCWIYPYWGECISSHILRILWISCTLYILVISIFCISQHSYGVMSFLLVNWWVCWGSFMIIVGAPIVCTCVLVVTICWTSRFLCTTKLLVRSIGGNYVASDKYISSAICNQVRNRDICTSHWMYFSCDYIMVYVDVEEGWVASRIRYKKLKGSSPL